MDDPRQKVEAELKAFLERQEAAEHWTSRLDERTRKHVDYARHYAKHFAHGAPGHLDLMTIAALANLLDAAKLPGDDDLVKAVQP